MVPKPDKEALRCPKLQFLYFIVLKKSAAGEGLSLNPVAKLMENSPSRVISRTGPEVDPTLPTIEHASPQATAPPSECFSPLELCHSCRAPGHHANVCPKWAKRCFACHGTGHIAKECPTHRHLHRPPRTSAPRPASSSPGLSLSPVPAAFTYAAAVSNNAATATPAYERRPTASPHRDIESAVFAAIAALTAVVAELARTVSALATHTPRTRADTHVRTATTETRDSTAQATDKEETLMGIILLPSSAAIATQTPTRPETHAHPATTETRDSAAQTTATGSLASSAEGATQTPTRAEDHETQYMDDAAVDARAEWMEDALFAAIAEGHAAEMAAEDSFADDVHRCVVLPIVAPPAESARLGAASFNPVIGLLQGEVIARRYNMDVAAAEHLVLTMEMLCDLRALAVRATARNRAEVRVFDCPCDGDAVHGCEPPPNMRFDPRHNRTMPMCDNIGLSSAAIVETRNRDTHAEHQIRESLCTPRKTTHLNVGMHLDRESGGDAPLQEPVKVVTTLSPSSDPEPDTLAMMRRLGMPSIGSRRTAKKAGAKGYRPPPRREKLVCPGGHPLTSSAIPEWSCDECGADNDNETGMACGTCDFYLCMVCVAARAVPPENAAPENASPESSAPESAAPESAAHESAGVVA